MPFHEHSTLSVTRLKNEELQLDCSTCGKSWQKGFALQSQGNASGVQSVKLVDTETGEKIECDALSTKAKQKKYEVKSEGDQKGISIDLQINP